MFCSPGKQWNDYPKLKGKAAELKSASPAILAVCMKLLRPGHSHEAPCNKHYIKISVHKASHAPYKAPRGTAPVLYVGLSPYVYVKYINS